MMQLQLNSKKFGTNLGGRAFFFFGFTLKRFIETANSFVLNTLLPAGRQSLKSGSRNRTKTSFCGLPVTVGRLAQCVLLTIN